MREIFEYHIFFHFLKPCLQDLWQDILENKSWWITVWTCCWYMRHINAGLKRLSVCIHTCGIILNIFGNKSIKGHIQHFKMASVLWLEVHFILCMKYKLKFSFQTLQWCHNERDGIWNYQPHDCLLNHLFKALIKENIKALCHWPLWGELPVNSPHKWPVTRKMFPFDDVIMMTNILSRSYVFLGCKQNIKVFHCRDYFPGARSPATMVLSVD